MIEIVFFGFFSFFVFKYCFMLYKCFFFIEVFNWFCGVFCDYGIVGNIVNYD